MSYKTSKRKVLFSFWWNWRFCWPLFQRVLLVIFFCACAAKWLKARFYGLSKKSRHQWIGAESEEKFNAISFNRNSRYQPTKFLACGHNLCPKIWAASFHLSRIKNIAAFFKSREESKLLSCPSLQAKKNSRHQPLVRKPPVRNRKEGSLVYT